MPCFGWHEQLEYFVFWEFFTIVITFVQKSFEVFLLGKISIIHTEEILIFIFRITANAIKSAKFSNEFNATSKIRKRINVILLNIFGRKCARGHSNWWKLFNPNFMHSELQNIAFVQFGHGIKDSMDAFKQYVQLVYAISDDR